VRMLIRHQLPSAGKRRTHKIVMRADHWVAIIFKQTIGWNTNMKTKCLLINGSSHGGAGNTAILLSVFRSIGSNFEFQELPLMEVQSPEDCLPAIQWAEAFVFATGTYWDSCGWPMQRFLEMMTPTEGTAYWMGKPAAFLVTMHSVGGKSVLSRLQGVMNTFGVLIPPMSGIVLSTVGQLAMDAEENDWADDIWCLDDLSTIALNLRKAATGQQNYKSWEVDREASHEIWLDPDYLE